MGRMKQFVLIALIAGVPFGLIEFWWHDDGLLWALAGGLFFGVMMAFFMSKGIASHTVLKHFLKAGKPVFDDPDAEILYSGPANHFMKWEAVGGELYLTSKELLFQSHKFNFQKHRLSVPLDKITDVQVTKTDGSISNGLKIWLVEDPAESFVVEKSQEWREIIMKAKGME